MIAYALLKATNLGMRYEFKSWLEANPTIWEEFVELADQMRTRGRQNWSARAILHVLRWHRAVRDTGDEVFKINNNWSKELAMLYNAIAGVEFFRMRSFRAQPFVEGRDDD